MRCVCFICTKWNYGIDGNLVLELMLEWGFVIAFTSRRCSRNRSSFCFANVIPFVKSASYTKDDIDGDAREMFINLNGLLGPDIFAEVTNERTSFASCARIRVDH